MDNIQIKTGKTGQDFWRHASKNGLVRRCKVISKHSEILAWVKSRERVDEGMCTLTSSYCMYDCMQMTENLALSQENGLVTPAMRTTGK
jgi:hypothetical protein